MTQSGQVIAHCVGEPIAPFLALAVTVIETALIVLVMIADPAETPAWRATPSFPPS